MVLFLSPQSGLIIFTYSPRNGFRALLIKTVNIVNMGTQTQANRKLKTEWTTMVELFAASSFGYFCHWSCMKPVNKANFNQKNYLLSFFWAYLTILQRKHIKFTNHSMNFANVESELIELKSSQQSLNEREIKIKGLGSKSYKYFYDESPKLQNMFLTI